MKRLSLFTMVATASLCVFALDEFGEFATAKSEHPEFFRPGVCDNAFLSGNPWYVYCGDAEKCFDSELDSELYEEAEIQAKQNFYEYFRKNDPHVKVEVSGGRKLYQYAEGNMRYVVLGVPKDGVKVVNSPVITDLPENTGAREPSVEVASPAPTPSVASEPTISPKAIEEKTRQEETAAVEPLGKSSESSIQAQTTEEVQNDELDDVQKLQIYRARLENNPNDFRVRIRMARIFDRQGNVKRALRNLEDAAKLIVQDEYTVPADKAPDLHEIAVYAEEHDAGAMAIKCYRMLQRMGVPEEAAFATRRLSDLMLHYQ